MSVHKRMVRVSVNDYGVVGGRLRELAEDDRREMWYEERREMLVFRGTSLNDLKTFAEKCQRIIKEVEDEKLGPEGVMEKKELHELAQEKIKEALEMMYTDKVHKFNKLKLVEEQAMVFNLDEANFIKSRCKSLMKLYPCDVKFHRRSEQVFDFRLKGYFPHAENFVRHVTQLLKEREVEDDQTEELAAKLRRTTLA